MQKENTVINTKVKEVKIKSIKYVGKRDVYNLTMENNHNYFANGILISNCDSMRYLINTRIRKSERWKNTSQTAINMGDVENELQKILPQEQQEILPQQPQVELRKGRSFNTY